MTTEPETQQRAELSSQHNTLTTTPKPSTATPVAEIGTGITSLLEASKADNTTVTPREINQQLAKIQTDYDALTLEFGQNQHLFDLELTRLESQTGSISAHLHQLSAHAELQYQAQHKQNSSNIKKFDQTLEQASKTSTELETLTGATQAAVTTLANDIESSNTLLRRQQAIITEQNQRLDQFDASTELLQTATRGNKQKIEFVAKDIETKHSLALAQLKGLNALYSQQQSQLIDLQDFTKTLELQSQRIDRDLSLVAMDLGDHKQLVVKRFKYTNAAVTTIALLLFVSAALFKWAPAFVPTSIDSAIGETNTRINQVATALPHVTDKIDAQQIELATLTAATAADSQAVTELNQALDDLSFELLGPNNVGGSLVTPLVPLATTDWLLAQNPANYTIQLVGVYSYEDLIVFINQNATKLKQFLLAYSVTQRGQRDSYSLFYGSFATLDQARATREMMPLSLRVNHPWVRQLQSVQAAAD
jgi:septal ring-binding cell division protein DamX